VRADPMRGTVCGHKAHILAGHGRGWDADRQAWPDSTFLGRGSLALIERTFEKEQ